MLLYRCDRVWFCRLQYFTLPCLAHQHTEDTATAHFKPVLAPGDVTALYKELGEAATYVGYINVIRLHIGHINLHIQLETFSHKHIINAIMEYTQITFVDVLVVSSLCILTQIRRN